MRKKYSSRCSLTFSSKDRVVIQVYNSGDGFELASRVEDFMGRFSKGNLDGLTYDDRCLFNCQGPCKFHFTIQFADDDKLFMGWDDEELSQKSLKMLARMIEDHDALMCACGVCEGNHDEHWRKIFL